MKLAAIIAAAGEGSRVGLGYNKLLYRIDGKTVLQQTLELFSMPKIVLFSEQDETAFSELLADSSDITLVCGGCTRSASVKNGLLEAQRQGFTHVLIHDGARPQLHPEDLTNCVNALAQYGSCVCYTPCADTLRIDGVVVDRKRAMLMSTPQAFCVEELLSAYNAVDPDAFTDDASIFESVHGAPHFAPLRHPNPKITTAGDLQAYANLFPRVGAGKDEHRLADGRKCILCGVTLPVEYGPLGHSDADVAIHALMDAMLSAAGLKDIGTYFPDTDEAYKDADSTKLLSRVVALIAEVGFAVANVSLVIHAQRPRLAPHIDTFKQSLSALLGISEGAIGITATSGENMGHIGRGEGIACDCVCSLRRIV